MYIRTRYLEQLMLPNYFLNSIVYFNININSLNIYIYIYYNLLQQLPFMT